MHTCQVPAGQSSIAVALNRDAPAVVVWPHAYPVEIGVAADDAPVTYGVRRSASPGDPGTDTVPPGQARIVSVRAEATPIVVYLTTTATSTVATVTGYRASGVPVATSDSRAVTGPGRGVVAITMTDDGRLRFAMSDGTVEYTAMPSFLPVDEDMPSLSIQFENGLV